MLSQNKVSPEWCLRHFCADDAAILAGVNRFFTGMNVEGRVKDL